MSLADKALAAANLSHARQAIDDLMRQIAERDCDR